jgi:hypothetical protein
MYAILSNNYSQPTSKQKLMTLAQESSVVVLLKIYCHACITSFQNSLLQFSIEISIYCDKRDFTHQNTRKYYININFLKYNGFISCLKKYSEKFDRDNVSKIKYPYIPRNIEVFLKSKKGHIFIFFYTKTTQWIWFYFDLI